MKKQFLFLLIISSLAATISCKKGTISDPLDCLWSIRLQYKDKNTGENLIFQNELFVLNAELQKDFVFTNNGDTVFKKFCCFNVQNGNELEVTYDKLCDDMEVLSGRSWDCHFTIQYQDSSMSPDTFWIEYNRNSDMHTASLYYNNKLLEKTESPPIHGYQLIFNPQTIEK